MTPIQTCIPEIGPPVSDADIRVWLLTVPRIDPDGPRAAAYVRGYDVFGKIQSAKLAGDWPPMHGFIAQ